MAKGGIVVSVLFTLSLVFVGFRYWQSRIRPPDPFAPGVGITYMRNGVSSHVNFPVTVTRRTPAGIAVDDPKNELPDDVIDSAMRTVEECIKMMPPKFDSIQASILTGNCHFGDRRLVDRSSIVVKVAPDWHASACTNEEVFPCEGEDIQAGCALKIMKGELQPNDCPCMCRRDIEYGSVAVVTPKAKLLKAALTTIVTSCENPWFRPLTQCAD